LIVIGQFLTLTASSILLLLIVDHALWALLLLRGLTQCCETGRILSRMRGKSSINEVYVWIKRCTIDPGI